MDTDLEQGGDLASAALLATQVGAPPPPAHTAATAAHCLNCGAGLTGRFCANCGQAAHVQRSLLHLLEEFAHSLLHFDARGWRTLPLLAVRPGVLTRRYIDGQRVRYVSPLALFLFNSFLMFFIVSLFAGHEAVIQRDLDGGISEARQDVERAQAALAAARQAGRGVEEAGEDLLEAQAEQRAVELARQQGGPEAASIEVKSGYPWLDRLINRVQRNPDLFRYRLQNTASKYLFVLIPISLPFLWLLFAGRPGIGMYDHAVFSLYSLSFMSLLLAACAVVLDLGWEATGLVGLLGIPPLHMFLQLKDTYALSVPAALWRTAALLAVAGTAFALFTLFVMLVSLR